MKILVTGAYGFLGKHISLRLEECGHQVLKYGRNDEDLEFKIEKADAIFHLASVMRSSNLNEFNSANVELTKLILDSCIKLKKIIPIIFSSSIQADTHTVYGISKTESENLLIEYHKKYNNNLKIFRLKWLFGKWSKPFAHSVVSTFIAQVQKGENLSIHDPKTIIELNYIDDVVNAMVQSIDLQEDLIYKSVSNEVPISIGELALKLTNFRDLEEKGYAPNLINEFERRLYSTYLSFIDEKNIKKSLVSKTDNRGSFTEIFKSKNFGQISVNITKENIEKGNHYHHTKHEKFLVISGHGEINLRNLNSEEIMTFKVSEEKLEMIDIPPGYVHSIKNIGNKDLVTLMWANEVFDIEKPDTFSKKV